MTVVPAILCGGAGTRLWPLSRSARPKQFHALTSERTLLAEALARAALAPGAATPLLIAGEAMGDILAAEAPSGVRVVLEPDGRNTAPAAALAALAALEASPDAIVLMLPSDHHIGDPDAFAAAVAKGARLAAEDRLVTFGVEPDGPNEGYGYITAGVALEHGGFAVTKFVEKPRRAVAEALIAAGGATWNSGIYMFGARVYLDELGRLAPAIRAAAEQAWRRGRDDERGARHLDATAWNVCPADSIDYAVAEKTDRAAVVPVRMAWSDVGSWASLHEAASRDADGNATSGEVVVLDAHGCHVRAESRLVAVVGVDDLVVVETADAVLVMPKARAQEVKTVVERLKALGRTDLL